MDILNLDSSSHDSSTPTDVGYPSPPSWLVSHHNISTLPPQLDYVDLVNNSMTSLNNGSLRMPELYSSAYKILGCLSVSLIFVAGLVGNLLVILVVRSTKSMHTPTNCYIVSLAVADILLLVSAPLPTLIELFLIVDESVLGPAGCSLMVFSQVNHLL